MNPATPSGASSTELAVPNISCQHCAKAVREALLAADPAAQVHVDVAQKRVAVHSPLPFEQLAHALAEAGYPATRAG